ncbi:MAG: hypothetical protein JO050_08170, partial [Acidimicrobiia bacterium]|nr:hypothetical protein [Acidimicrobiia bacterium]
AISPVAVAVSVVLVGGVAAWPGLALAQTAPAQAASGAQSVTKTVSRVKADDGSVAETVNYTVGIKPQARPASTSSAAAAGTDTYGNPLEPVSLQGLPSAPFAGAAGPLESGQNPGLNNEAPGGVSCPPAGKGHEYLVVWAGKMNAGDLTGTDIVDLVNGGSVNPEGLIAGASDQLAETGSDMMATIDAEPGCNTYGKVVNVATVSGPDGIENEPHHMQYTWFPNQSVWAGGLFTSRLFTFDLSDLPRVTLQKTDEPWATPSGSIWDAFATLPNGDAYGTLMGGPLYAYGTTPGAVVEIAGAQHPGMNPGDIIGEWPANSPNSLVNGLNTNGSMVGALAQDLGATATNVPNLVLPTNCADKSGGTASAGQQRAGCETGLDPTTGEPKCPDFGSCANPHGIQFRQDLGALVTSDYAEPGLIVEDPVKPVNPYEFRRTVRVWSTRPGGCSGNATPGAGLDAPKICAVDVMPLGPRDDSNPAHAENLGIMENGATWDYPLPDGKVPKGWFSESMCGGAVFYTPDITDTLHHPWHEVFDSTAAVNALTTPSPGGRQAGGGNGGQATQNEPAGCDGAAWDVVSPDNRFLGHAVNGRYVLADNYQDAGTPKLVYTLNITKLLEAGDNYQCNLDSNIRALADPTLGGPDCPTVAGVVPINDPTSGGPHWAEYDNFRLGSIKVKDPATGEDVTDTHAATRIAEANYFVARTGVDGNHTVCMLNISPTSGALSLDTSFVDETEGTPCVQFNRRDWPDPNIKGFYKPHSMLFVEDGAPPTGLTPYGNDYGPNCAFGAVVDGACHGYWGEPINMGADTAGLPYQE